MLFSALISTFVLAAPAAAGFDYIQLKLSGTNLCLDNREGRLANRNTVQLYVISATSPFTSWAPCPTNLHPASPSLSPVLCSPN